MRLESWHSAEDKAKWKIVRLDNYDDVICDSIITADEDTGECCIQIKGESVTRSFGPKGIKLVGKKR